jgi:large subunit ribosomal protein L25
VAGKTYKAIVKELQADPVKDSINHIDFQELVGDVKVKIEVPLKLEGTPVAISMGGKLEQLLRKLKVFALPKDLPELIILNVKDMDFGHVKRIKDMSIEGVTFLHSPNTPVVRLATSRAAREAQAAAAKEAAAAGGKKK